MKLKDRCEYCLKAQVEIVKGNDPYTIDHLQCPRCDSTYILED